MKTEVFRLVPGQDLKQFIETYVVDNSISGSVVTCVGRLKQAVIRMAGAEPDDQDVRTYGGDFEVVSLVGTLSPDGVHLHMSFSDKEGVVLGGHLKDGTLVDPTVELVLLIETDKEFSRSPDVDTGFDELVIKNKDKDRVY